MLENFDLNHQIFFGLQSWVRHYDFLDTLFIFIAEYLIFILLFFYLIFFWRLIWRDKKVEIREFIVYFSGAFFAWLLAVILKIFIVAERPFSALNLDTLLEHHKIFNSFPSGHSTFSFALAFSVFLYDKKAGSVLLILAVLVALGRVLTGVHYPLDIFFGALLGILTSYILFKIMKKYKPSP